MAIIAYLLALLLVASFAHADTGVSGTPPGHGVSGSSFPLSSGATAGQALANAPGSQLALGTFDMSNFPTGGGAVAVFGDTTAFRTAIEGVAVNTLAGNPLNFPTAIGALGYLRSAGNNIFGITSAVNVYTRGNGSNEFDVSNWNAAPSSQLPPDYSINTPNTNLTGLYLGAGGTFNSIIALAIGPDGAAPQQFLTGIYLNANCCATYGMVIDAATAAGSQGPGTVGLLIKEYTALNLQLQTSGPLNANFGVMQVADANGVIHLSIRQNGDIYPNNVFPTSSIVGPGGSDNGLAGSIVISPGNFGTSGDSQTWVTTIRNATSGATSAVLTTNCCGAGASLPMANSSAAAVHLTILARDFGNGAVASWNCDNVLVKRLANAAQTSIVGTPTCTQVQADGSMSTATVAVTADTTNGGLLVTATGVSGENVRWDAEVRAVYGQ